MTELEDRLGRTFGATATSWRPSLPSDLLTAAQGRADRNRTRQRRTVAACTMLLASVVGGALWQTTEAGGPTRTVRTADDPDLPTVVDDVIAALPSTTIPALVPTLPTVPAPAHGLSPRPPATTEGAPTTTAPPPPAASPLDEPGIYTMRPDGTGLRKLLIDPAIRPWSPKFSPDGHQIAFFSGTNLDVIDAAGGGRRRLAESIYAMSAPYWSPDGRHLAFFTREDQGYPLHVIDVATGKDVFVLRDRSATAYDWSPDGKRLAVITTGSVGIFAIDDSNEERTIASSPTMGRLVRWSPRGNRIVYAHMVDAPNDLHAELVAIDPDGGNPRNLGRADGDEHSVAWSPDGTQLAVTDGDKGDLRGTTYLVSADGSHRRLLAEDSVYPTWSPASDRLVLQTSHPYHTDAGGNPGYRLVLVDTSGTMLATLLEDPGTGEWLTGDPQWSPLGDQIIFTAIHTEGNGSYGLARG